ncbi:unnamed protein product [Leuciscus chuanchicus]
MSVKERKCFSSPSGPNKQICEDGLPLADGALINTWALSSQHHGQVSPRKPSQDQAPGTCAQGEEEQTTHLLFNITHASQLIDQIRIKCSQTSEVKLLLTCSQFHQHLAPNKNIKSHPMPRRSVPTDTLHYVSRPQRAVARGVAGRSTSH